jgi:hypothetical protein
VDLPSSTLPQVLNRRISMGRDVERDMADTRKA